MRRASLLLACVLAASNVLPVPARAAGNSHAPASRTQTRLTADEDAFLEDLSRRAFLYFKEHADPDTGLVLDRARASGEAHPASHHSHNITSSAATGFGLTALCIGAERGWIPRAEARERVAKTLRFFAERAPHVQGWFPHWMNKTDGARRWGSEFSSIDTALLLGGVLTARGYFREDAEIRRLATFIYERVDFRWMLDGHPTLLSHGWKPETGFLKPRWDTYSEHLILQLLAVGSPSKAITPRAWRAWNRKRITYAGRTYLNDGPLFTHQYSHAWVDFRGWRESWYPFTDYFENSQAATRSHRDFCLSLAGEFPGYTEDVWGITASDSERGYVAWGGPPRDPSIDGTVVPCAAGGSLMFTPDITLRALRTMKEKFGERLSGRYGFADAFNPNNGWTNPDVIGINVGITLLSAENLRSGNVWRWFMTNREIPRAMRLVGMRKEGRRG
ncbi:MAG TPA: glucoamylase family protein [Pyrinomonadaceae bacterium]|nr:glucoamylase family protein [Pyrinomonadaceae bacterium]